MQALTFDELLRAASLDQDQYDYLVHNVKHGWDTGAPELIRTVQAPMSAGKTYTLGRATIPLLAQMEPSTSVFMYSSPRGDLTSVFYNDALDYLNYKDIVCSDGTVKTLRVYNSAELTSLMNEIDRAISRGKTAKQVLGSTVVVLSVTIQWLLKNFNRLISLLKIDYSFFDEAHIGLQIGEITRGIINPDSGRYLPEDYDPKWKPMAMRLATQGRVVEISATLSKSQLADGVVNSFYPLAIMPKRNVNQSFPKAHFEYDTETLLKKFKTFNKARLRTTLKLIAEISSDTWVEAEKINVFPQLGRSLVRSGCKGAVNGISLFDNKEALFLELRDHTKSLAKPSIFAVATSEKTILEKIVSVYFKEEYLDPKQPLTSIISKLNDPINYMSPALLAVINMGTVGMSVLDIDTIVYLTLPANPGEVVSSQVQTMGRGNRFPFKGMRNHEQMRQLINSLNISLTQKYALTQYVVHKCETHVFMVRTSLMTLAYEEYSDFTMTSDEGLQFYMSSMSPASPAYVKPVAKPSYGLSYDASALNATYKKQHCECCEVIDANGTTTCEHDARANLEKIEGPMTDEKWSGVWFKVLHLHHDDVNHHNYDPANLITACPNMHMGITIIGDHANKRYN
jgi:hypothetical protein